MGKIMYSTNLSGFRSEGGALRFMHGDEKITLLYSDITEIRLMSNMSAKNGAYVKCVVDSENICLVTDSDNEQFFDVLFDMLCIELNVDMVEVFNISAAETKTEKTVYKKEI